MSESNSTTATFKVLIVVGYLPDRKIRYIYTHTVPGTVSSYDQRRIIKYIFSSKFCPKIDFNIHWSSSKDDTMKVLAERNYDIVHFMARGRVLNVDETAIALNLTEYITEPELAEIFKDVNHTVGVVFEVDYSRNLGEIASIPNVYTLSSNDSWSAPLTELFKASTKLYKDIDQMLSGVRPKTNIEMLTELCKTTTNENTDNYATSCEDFVTSIPMSKHDVIMNQFALGLGIWNINISTTCTRGSQTTCQVKDEHFMRKAVGIDWK